MKPRRDSGATFVSPMTSGVSRDSALMMDFLWLVGAPIQQAIPADGKSPDREGSAASPAGHRGHCRERRGVMDAGSGCLRARKTPAQILPEANRKGCRTARRFVTVPDRMP